MDDLERLEQLIQEWLRADGRFHHVTVTRTGSGRAIVYIDGKVLEDEAPPAPPAPRSCEELPYAFLSPSTVIDSLDFGWIQNLGLTAGISKK